MFNVGDCVVIGNTTATCVAVPNDMCFVVKHENGTFEELEYVDEDTYYSLYEELDSSLDLQTSLNRVEMWMKENMSD